MQASDGNFYGVTGVGGSNRCMEIDNWCGAVIKMTPSGKVTLLHDFNGAPLDGQAPSGPLIQSPDGSLYGVTISGGEHNKGTVYRLSATGQMTILHSFGPTSADYHPLGRLLRTNDGTLYGAAQGGPNNCIRSGTRCGIIFRISNDRDFSVIYAFREQQGEGAVPNGSLIDGRDGFFYGTTGGGGDYSCSVHPGISGCGTIFRITPSGEITYLHIFGTTESAGRQPQGALIRAADGTFYGTTRHGGRGRCDYPGRCGTVFRMDSAGAVTNMHEFSPEAPFGRRDGFAPGPYLELASDGNLYGITEDGGYYESVRTGTIFRITPGGAKSTLYSFGNDLENPTQPTGGIVEGRDGNFYGMTFRSGSLGSVGPIRGQGAIYRMSRY